MKTLLILAVFTWTPFVFAQLDNASEIGVKKTQEVLNSPDARQKYIDTHADAKAADDKAAEVAGTKEDKDQMYGIAGDITRTLATKNGGDADKMKAEMEKAQKDPEGFYNGLTAEQKSQIDALSNKIESEKPSGLNQP